MTNKRYTVTSALPYANGPLHLGHVAGVYLPASIFVRFLRMKGVDVAYICGSDEHGAAITLRAKKEGVSPQEIVDKYHLIIRNALRDFDILPDIFHRTSAEIHRETAQEFFLKLHREGHFTQETSEQYFDEEHQQFLADRYIFGTCPKCYYEHAYGDQCEKCGSTLSPTELIDPKSTLSGTSPVLKETSHWFLPMNRHEDWLRSWITKGELNGRQQHDPKAWRNQVLGQCMSWIDGGLKPRAMTRDLDWGIPVPIAGAENKVLYVWLDAPIGYISATKQWAKDNGKNWENYWKDEDTKLVHFIGKDNIVFHAIIFPMLLKAHGDYILPDNVPASEFLNLEGDKFSTSRNWAVWLHEYLDRHPDKVDELKYTLTAIAPESKDAEFTWKEFQARVNNELADVLGNFINRALVLTHKYFNGKVPRLNEIFDVDLEVLDALQAIPERIADLMMRYRIREAQAEAMNLARVANKYLAETEPWKLIKTDESRVHTILYISLQLTANLGIVLHPFLSKTSSQILKFLNLPLGDWSHAGRSDLLEPGHQINQPENIFQKIDDAFVETEVELLKNANPLELPKADPAKEEISFEDFSKLDVRVAQILEAERIPKANKLLKLRVNTGLDIRTIVSGIAEHYQPEDLIGKSVVVLVNLAPRKIRGVESQGMILMADNGKELALIQDIKGFVPGSTVS